MRAAGLFILAAGSKKFFVQITDLHMEPFYNPENGHQHGNVCRIPEALNKSTCAPFRVEETADVYMIVYFSQGVVRDKQASFRRAVLRRTGGRNSALSSLSVSVASSKNDRRSQI